MKVETEQTVTRIGYDFKSHKTREVVDREGGALKYETV